MAAFAIAPAKPRRSHFGYESASQKLAPDESARLLPQLTKGGCHGSGSPKLCVSCQTPVSEAGYADSGTDENLQHAACKAKAIQKCVNESEAIRRQRTAAFKREKRSEFGLGWKPLGVPTSSHIASLLGCSLKPNGLCCLVLDEGMRTVQVAATSNPAHAVNLEYLAIALRVRRWHGREPFFSLDPVLDCGEGRDDEAAWQEKRFEPSWLSGTSLGNVLFQADYHLKELSMGECDQPIVGMMSCFDHASTQWDAEEWTAREWFVVRYAEVQVDSGGALTPCVQLGVEAKEQVRVGCSLEDAAMTRPDHPLVRYANDFSENFEVIAERKSVMHSLREVAKAVVIAKFLLECGVHVQPAWFEVEIQSADTCKRVPQLWNERHHSKLHINNGRIEEWDTGIRSSKRGVYGGVELGLERFPLQEIVSAPARISRKDSAPRPDGFEVVRTFVQTIAEIMPLVPQGVDLSLEKHNLSEMVPCKHGCKQHFPVAAGIAFFMALDINTGGNKLFNALFNPCMSDRREEGEFFIPPVTSKDKLEKYENILRKEEEILAARTHRFLSPNFEEFMPDSVFPPSWIPPMEVLKAIGETLTEVKWETISSQSVAPSLDRVIKSTAPDFDKFSEDGARFRIYRVGAYEVRTIQYQGKTERKAAIFKRSNLPSF